MADTLPPITVHQFGKEREPIVQIDAFSGTVDTLRQRAKDADWQPGGAAYPGIRAWCEPDYLDRRRDLVFSALQNVFGFRQGVQLDASTFSLVTTPPADLSPIQRVPHYDNAAGELIAVMHYLLGPETGGTAFYRHRRTGFETITPEREAAYGEGQRQDAAEHGDPSAAYFHGDDPRYELIGEIEARPDRFVMYRGRALHSGVIPAELAPSDDPEKGRLTINMFLRGR